MALLQELIRDDGQGQYNPTLARYVIDRMIAENAIWSVAQWYTMRGNADAPYKAGSGSAGGTRNIGSDFSTTTANPTTDTFSLAIYGGKVATDIAFARRGDDLGTERTRQLAQEASAISRGLVNDLVNGDGAAGHLRGLATTAPSVTFGGANGGEFPADDKKKIAAFLEFLRRQMIYTGCNCIIANSDFIGRLEMIEKEHVRYDSVQSAFDDAQLNTLRTYKTVPLIDAGFNRDMSGLVIDNTETVGTSTDCTSIYLVRWGEKTDLSLATNVGMQVKDLGVQGSAYVTQIEIDVQVAYLSPRAALRIKGIRLNV